MAVRIRPSLASKRGAEPWHGAAHAFRVTVASLLLSVGLLPVAFTCPAAGQDVRETRPSSLFFLGINVGIATVSAVLEARSAGASIERALAAGLVGGSLMYGGQRVVATGRPAFRLLGLETVAVGANVTRNVARELPPLSDLALPVFPFYVRVRTDGTRPAVRVRLSAVAAVSTVRMAMTSGRSLDFLESLYSGAAVFSRPDGSLPPCLGFGISACAQRVGEHRFGAVTCSVGGTCEAGDVLTHEFEHVAQDVRDAVLFATPVSDRLLGRSGSFGRWVSRYLVIDAFLPLMFTNGLLDPVRVHSTCGPHANFYECETEALLRR